MGKRYKTYRNGDLITVSVTKGYGEVASAFFRYCGENHYNPSEIIRELIYNWLMEKKGGMKLGQTPVRSTPTPLRIPEDKSDPHDISNEIFKQLIGGDGE